MQPKKLWELPGENREKRGSQGQKNSVTDGVGGRKFDRDALLCFTLQISHQTSSGGVSRQAAQLTIVSNIQHLCTTVSLGPVSAF